jgi:hypothetical protein
VLAYLYIGSALVSVAGPLTVVHAGIGLFVATVVDAGARAGVSLYTVALLDIVLVLKLACSYSTWYLCWPWCVRCHSSTLVLTRSQPDGMMMMLLLLCLSIAWLALMLPLLAQLVSIQPQGTWVLTRHVHVFLLQ